MLNSRCNCKASAATGEDGNRNRKETETEATAELRQRGKVRVLRVSSPGVKVRVETVCRLTVATQRQVEKRRKEGANKKEEAAWGERKVKELEKLEIVAHFPWTEDPKRLLRKRKEQETGR